jgi:ubiquinone/menaquinone biosynthesis C-methylase UbiE/uncharacterized protein YbaR (Trm112 family)
MMKDALISNLRCIECGEIDLRLQVTNRSEVEIRTGLIRCSSCQTEYRIENGVPDMISSSVAGWIRQEQQFSNRVFNERIQAFGSVEAAENFRKQQALGQDEETFYDRWTRSMMKQVARNVKCSPETLVVEIGGSPGRDLCDRFVSKGCQGIEVDISTEMPIMSEYIINDRGIYYDRIVGTFEKIPLRDQVADIVFASATIHHAEDPQTVFREVRRILKPNGVFIMVNERVVSRLLPSLKEEIRNEYEDAHESAYFFNEWTMMLKYNGFRPRVQKRRYFTPAIRYVQRYENFKPGTWIGFVLQYYM